MHIIRKTLLEMFGLGSLHPIYRYFNCTPNPEWEGVVFVFSRKCLIVFMVVDVDLFIFRESGREKEREVEKHRGAKKKN